MFLGRFVLTGKAIQLLSLSTTGCGPEALQRAKLIVWPHLPVNEGHYRIEDTHTFLT
jgi:hypothetical protein